jgi:hypothetical protein
MNWAMVFIMFLFGTAFNAVAIYGAYIQTELKQDSMVEISLLDACKERELQANRMLISTQEMNDRMRRFLTPTQWQMCLDERDEKYKYRHGQLK